MVSALVGIPNLIISLLTFVAGVIGLIVVAFMIIALIFEDTGDDALAGFIIILFIILLIIALIGLFIVLIILAVLLLGFSGQVIGGILAYRGRRFGLSIALLVIGTIMTFSFGGITVLTGLFSSAAIWLKALFVLWGIYSIGSAIATGICTARIAGTRSTFSIATRPRNDLKNTDR